MIPVYEHTVLDIRIMVVVDNHYISGTDVAMKNMRFERGCMSCKVHQNTVIRRKETIYLPINEALIALTSSLLDLKLVSSRPTVSRTKR